MPATKNTQPVLIEGSAAYENRDQIRSEIAESVIAALMDRDDIALITKAINSNGPLGGVSSRIVAGTSKGLGVIISVYCDTRSDEVLSQELDIEKNRKTIIDSM